LDPVKDSKAASSTSESKGHYEATRENSQSDKDSSGSEDSESSFRANRRKRNDNIRSDAIDKVDGKSFDNSSKEAAE
jgi:hypothetical protein